MLNDPPRPLPITQGTPSIRRQAVAMAALVGVVNVGTLWDPGVHTLMDAVLIGLSSGATGLIGWSAYHGIDRQNNGLLLVTMGGLPFNPSVRPPIIVSCSIRGVMVAVVVGAIAGIFGRVVRSLQTRWRTAA